MLSAWTPTASSLDAASSKTASISSTSATAGLTKNAKTTLAGLKDFSTALPNKSKDSRFITLSTSSVTSSKSLTNDAGTSAPESSSTLTNFYFTTVATSELSKKKFSKASLGITSSLPPVKDAEDFGSETGFIQTTQLTTLAIRTMLPGVSSIDAKSVKSEKTSSMALETTTTFLPKSSSDTISKYLTNNCTPVPSDSKLRPLPELDDTFQRLLVTRLISIDTTTTSTICLDAYAATMKEILVVRERQINSQPNFRTKCFETYIKFETAVKKKIENKQVSNVSGLYIIMISYGYCENMNCNVLVLWFNLPPNS